MGRMGPGLSWPCLASNLYWALLEAIGGDELLLLAELQQSNDAVKTDAVPDVTSGRDSPVEMLLDFGWFRHSMQHVSSITTGPYSPIKLGMISHVAFRVFRVKSRADRADRAQQRNISVICDLCFPISVLFHGKALLKKSCEDLQRQRAERKKLEVQSSWRGQIWWNQWSWNQFNWKCMVY